MNREETENLNFVEGGEDHAKNTTDESCLVVDSAEPLDAVHAVRDLLAVSGEVFDHGGPTKIVTPADRGPPKAVALNADQIVGEVHRLRQPVKRGKDGRIVPIALPSPVARMYLKSGDWKLPLLAGICTSPLLTPDGSIRVASGYDQSTKLWCADIPALTVPEFPSRADAESALLRLRRAFRTFPFADAPRQADPAFHTDVVNVDVPPQMDESAFLAGLMTAISRASLPLAPGFLVRAPELSGSGTGKGLLTAAICTIAFGCRPFLFTRGEDRGELERRLASALMEAAPAILLDNVNSSTLHSNLLASVLSERTVRTRALGGNRMLTLNSTSFIAVNGNGLAVSEDLARRFIVCELDALC
jgi:putative DNA primase/helicase